MLSNHETHLSSPRDAAALAAETVFDPRSPIEVASSGSGSTNDTGPDTRPPVTAGDEAIA